MSERREQGLMELAGDALAHDELALELLLRYDRDPDGLSAEEPDHVEILARRHHLRRVIEIGRIFRDEFGESRPERIRPVYAHWFGAIDDHWKDQLDWAATHWEPLIQNGSAAGLIVRLLEGYGRPAKVTLSSFRTVASARRTDYLGQTLGDCDVEQDKVRFEMAPREWTQLELRF